MPSRGNAHRYQRPRKSAYAPLQIRAWLRSPVVSDASLPIDGVIYAMKHRQMLGAETLTISGAPVHAQAFSGCTLPLMRVNEHGPQWFYAASFAQWPDVIVEGKDHWNCRLDTKHLDLVDFGKLKARVDIGAGAYKSHHMPIFYRHALHVDWYVMGIESELAELLIHCTHLGKKTSQGWGRVAQWEINRQTEDWSVLGPGGRLMRAIPAERGVLTGFRPSYWEPRNQATCEAP